MEDHTAKEQQSQYLIQGQEITVCVLLSILVASLEEGPLGQDCGSETSVGHLQTE